jgi:hypothetical protein
MAGPVPETPPTEPEPTTPADELTDEQEPTKAKPRAKKKKSE